MNVRSLLITAFVILSIIALVDMVFIPSELADELIDFNFEFHMELPERGR